jgi:hypothetical protein
MTRFVMNLGLTFASLFAPMLAVLLFFKSNVYVIWSTEFVLQLFLFDYIVAFGLVLSGRIFQNPPAAVVWKLVSVMVAATVFGAGAKFLGAVDANTALMYACLAAVLASVFVLATIIVEAPTRELAWVIVAILMIEFGTTFLVNVPLEVAGLIVVITAIALLGIVVGLCLAQLTSRVRQRWLQRALFATLLGIFTAAVAELYGGQTALRDAAAGAVAAVIVFARGPRWLP